jgi:type II secretory ATPase GspE/PulE/Tfp pilus assembly ATPase PilB-like protein
VGVDKAGFSAVHVSLLDGAALEGSVRSFEPSSTDLFVEVAGGDGPAVRRVPAESVAWVGFRRPSDRPPAPGPPASASSVRVHLPRGRSVLVHPGSDTGDALGFWGVPVEGDSPFERIYFYTHGRLALERNETLGAMLVNQGVVEPDDLARGLDHQASLRRRRIGEILLEQKCIEAHELDEALALQHRQKLRLGEVLVDAGLVSEEDVQAALAEQTRHRGRRIGEILVEMGVVSERRLAEALAEKFHLPIVDLDDCLIDPAALEALPPRVLLRYGILPIEVDGDCITVAISDPLNTDATDQIRFHRSGRVREVVGIPSQIEQYLRNLVGPSGGDVEALAEGIAAGLEDEGEAGDRDDAHPLTESDNGVIQLVNRILAEAIRLGASDVHIEPNGPAPVGVRFRVDGKCIPLSDVPTSYRFALVSRLKIMARLDIAERRKPQDGKIRLRLPERTVDVRVATLPTVGGEDVVLRILDSRTFPLRELGLATRDLAALERLVAMPHGLLLCVGPTGSGKSTTLHSLLAHINRPERKIWTAEDPVEITQEGLRQVPVRPGIGFGFAEALRAFLRADPDVIMIGEMRDYETAKIAVEASLTGHLVFSTLHTNSAPETVVRLVEMGIDPLSFGDALLGVLAQRLVRRLCPACRRLEPAPDADVETVRGLLGDASDEAGRLLWRAPGCAACRETGYRGRIAVHELLVVDEGLRVAIHQRAGADRLRALAREGGMRSLAEQGARRCLDGSTDVAQVLATCLRS